VRRDSDKGSDGSEWKGLDCQMVSLTWEQVHAWRLEQHCLAPRLARQDSSRAVERVLGLQAQVMSAAELALGARVDALTREDVQAGMWQDRTLVRTWAMRGTLHLFAAQDLPLVVAARSAGGSRPWLSFFVQNGFTEAQYDEMVLTVPEVLGEEPMTREALANVVAAQMNAPQVSKALLTSSWGTLWKPSMFKGDLCFGPSEGRTNTFVNPRKWLRNWKESNPHDAVQEVARRYLSTYGPATPRDFSFWWNGGGTTFGKEAFNSLKDEAVSVEVEGWKATALRSSIEAMERAGSKAEHTVRLLPMFDVYVLARSRNLEPVLDMGHKGKVFRPAAWVSAVVLVDGRIKGVWEYETRKQQTTVKVSMFDSPSPRLRKEVEGEVERIGSFLGTGVAVDFPDAS
jgi:hypothetical protein